MGLSDKAILVCISISQWTGRKFDKQATGAIEAQFSTVGHAGNFTKKLLPGAIELDNISKLAGNIRRFVTDQTLPWLTDGTRILSSKNYLSFVREFGRHKVEFDSAVSDFLASYPLLRIDAQSKLGSLFKDSDYPAAERLRGAFQCDISLLPMPQVQDFRTEILESEKEAFIKSMQAVEAKAMQECWTRLYKVIEKAAERLKAPDAIFRDSLLENVQDLVEFLPNLNAADDPHLEAMRSEIERAIDGVSGKDCRESSEIRQGTAKSLSAIMEKMGAFMEGAQ